MSEILYDVILAPSCGRRERSHRRQANLTPNEYDIRLLTGYRNDHQADGEKQRERPESELCPQPCAALSLICISASVIKKKQSLKILTAEAQTTSSMIWWNVKLSLGTVTLIWLPKCLSQEESTRVLARDLQNVLLTGKTQNASKSEEIIQHRLLCDNGKWVLVRADMGGKVLNA